MTAQDAASRSSRELGPRELAGYRVLRSLARDEQAEVLLGHRSVTPTEADADTDGEAQPGQPAVQTVAIKVFESARDAALHECAALERARGDHVVNLLDVDADDDSIRLLFERLPRGDVSELLRIRSRLDAGEAVTLLAPIAVTLQRLHAAGVAHGNLSARTILFRDDGSPTLIGFSRAELFEPGAPEVVLEQVAAVRHDRDAARALATTVLARVTGPRTREARELRADLAGCDSELLLPLLATRLFDVAAAVAVRFTPDEAEMDAAATSPRAVPVGAAVVGSGADAPHSGSPRIAAALARLVPEPLVQRLLAVAENSPAAPVVAEMVRAARRRWGGWTPTRRRVVLAVGAAAVTVGVVTAAIPAGATGSAAAPTWAATPVASPSEAVTGTDDPDPGATTDDPLAASTALLRARQRCLSSLSLPCLDRVDEAGSGALDDDQASIRAAQQGGELPDPLGSATGDDAPVLIERLGDSALVRLGQAASGASLLLVKGDEGWRIRDVVAAAFPTTSPTTPPPTAPAD